ncbi:MAG: lytic transglycosylase domain-containing protein [Flavihumibacter sp.]
MFGSKLLRIAVCCCVFISLSVSAGTVHTVMPPAPAAAETTVIRQQPAAAFITSYLQSNAETLSAIRKKNKAAFRAMDKVLRRYKLPTELKYLAVVESEMNANALSKVGAAGTWQLMPETARELGLTVSDSIDQRLNVHLSTKAAALYLRDLYNQFDNWLLALAAYNCGPGPVYKAIRKSGSRDFWALQQYLPAESRGHVKKYIATHQYFEGKESGFLIAD